MINFVGYTLQPRWVGQRRPCRAVSFRGYDGGASLRTRLPPPPVGYVETRRLGATGTLSPYRFIRLETVFPTTPTIIKSRVNEYPFKLVALGKLENGDVQINVFADPNAAVELRATSDFQVWDVLDTVTVSEVPTLYTDSTAGGFTRRIYQGVTDE